MRACSLGLVSLGFRVRDKIRVSVRDRVGVRVGNSVRISTFYFVTLAAHRISQSRILPITRTQWLYTRLAGILKIDM